MLHFFPTRKFNQSWFFFFTFTFALKRDFGCFVLCSMCLARSNTSDSGLVYFCDHIHFPVFFCNIFTQPDCLFPVAPMGSKTGSWSTLSYRLLNVMSFSLNTDHHSQTSLMNTSLFFFFLVSLWSLKCLYWTKCFIKQYKSCSLKDYKKEIQFRKIKLTFLLQIFCLTWRLELSVQMILSKLAQVPAYQNDFL